MTIAEKVNLSHPGTQDTNSMTVYLFREGVFWIAYEQSAWAVSQVKQLKPTRKLVKAVGCDVVSVGFPDSALDTVAKHFENVEKVANRVTMKTQKPANMESFEAWRAEINIRHTTAPAISQNEISGTSLTSNVAIVEKIRSFNLSNKTPMECMIFLNQLKSECLTV
ncbi:MAG: hypothetical protein LBS54_08280 [Dysgonamonadaceae bacterium]|jgi:NADPH-dependent glutamate synthase beta subunit-like oxidoreductase|nr:hypothetical protein [Dysgonamonadaceae bacterium]